MQYRTTRCSPIFFGDLGANLTRALHKGCAAFAILDVCGEGAARLERQAEFTSTPAVSGIG